MQVSAAAAAGGLTEHCRERHLCLLPWNSIWPRTYLTMPRHATVFYRHQCRRRDNNESKTTWLPSPAFSLHLAGARQTAVVCHRP